MALVKQIHFIFDDGTAQTINVTAIEAVTAPAEDPVSQEKTEDAGTEVEATEVTAEA